MEKREVGKRLQELVNHFKMSQAKFSRELGMETNVIIGRIINSTSRTPSFPVLYQILTRFPEVNANWLITGRGPMIREGEAINSYIRYFGVVNSSEMGEVIEKRVDPLSVFHITGFEDCDYAFDVVGDSMAPKYLPGEIIICKKVQQESLVPGQPYLVIGEDVQAIRYLATVTEQAEFVFTAENNAYQKLSLKSHQIKHLCAVKGKIRRESY